MVRQPYTFTIVFMVKESTLCLNVKERFICYRIFKTKTQLLELEVFNVP